MTMVDAIRHALTLLFAAMPLDGARARARRCLLSPRAVDAADGSRHAVFMRAIEKMSRC